MISLKADLQSLMEHLLNLSREILASIHEERIVVGLEEIHHVKDILNRREELVEVYGKCYKDFLHILKSMREIPFSNYSLIEELEWLHTHLDAEDFELLLLSEQLVRVEQELETETQSLINFQKFRLAVGHPMSPYLLKELPKPVRLAVGLVEENEESGDSD